MPRDVLNADAALFKCIATQPHVSRVILDSSQTHPSHPRALSVQSGQCALMLPLARSCAILVLCNRARERQRATYASQGSTRTKQGKPFATLAMPDGFKISLGRLFVSRVWLASSNVWRIKPRVMHVLLDGLQR